MIYGNKSKYRVKMFLFITALIFMFISKLRFSKKVSIVTILRFWWEISLSFLDFEVFNVYFFREIKTLQKIKKI